MDEQGWYACVFLCDGAPVLAKASRDEAPHRAAPILQQPDYQAERCSIEPKTSCGVAGGL